LAHSRFREAAKEGKTQPEFFTSGGEHVERLLATVKEDLDPEFTHRRASDFGYGVERVTIPLAIRVAQEVGGGAPDLTLDDANKNCKEADVRNVTPPKSEDSLENLSCDFDFLHSFIVFQHIPARRDANILRAMPRRLSENGAGPLHFNLRDLSPRLETLVTRTPLDLPFGQRPNQPCKRRFFQTSINRDVQLQRQPVAPPSTRARISSCAPPVLRLWAIQGQSFTL